MLFKQRFIYPFICCSLFFIQVSAQQNLSKLVNPFIGTGGHGHTFPGAVVPFGMVQLSPDTRVDGSWDGCSGYHYSDSVIYGFSHTHLSGTGCSDWGDIMLMPMMGVASFDSKKYSSKFSHQQEKASAGFYSVHLTDDNIDVQLTTTTRVGFHQYTFNKAGKAHLILDLLHRDKLLDGKITLVKGANNIIEGFRRSEAWAKDQRVYFRIEFSKPFSNTQIVTKDSIQTMAAFSFDMNVKESLFVKVSISAVGTDGAQKNMAAELPHWNFEQVKNDAEKLWNVELNKIQVEGGTDEQRIVFYTALYHCFIHPSIANDVDGRYLGRDFKIHKTDGFNYYTVFSLWDTFRALHPLFNIVQRERNLDFIKTFLEQYKQCGRLPMWELSSNETNCMIGYHAVSVIADAYAKGIRGFDIDLAIEASIKAANYHEFGIPQFQQKGYLEIEDEHESVSKTLEYAYDNWCIASFITNTNQDFKKSNQFLAGSNAWKQLYNPSNHFFQARSNGGWYKPFRPNEVNNHYTEANAWQYSLFVPHNIEGYLDYTKPILLETFLDSLFTTSSNVVGRQQADISGMIGQYAHGNEPSHHFIYMYDYVNRKDKMASIVDKVMNEMYHNATDGLAGNEDCGQMSAWYVFSAMGFYPICPGKNEYVINQSLFNKVWINGELLDISKLPKRTSIAINESFNAIAPIINSTSQTFRDSMYVMVSNPNQKGIVKLEQYSLENEFLKRWESQNDTLGVWIKQSGKFKASLDTITSHVSSATFYKIPTNVNVQLKYEPNKQYTAGGADALIDGIRGDVNWRKGNWQGYQYHNFEAVIDLQEKKPIESLTTTFLQDSRSWILLPTTVEYWFSDDGESYYLAGTVSHQISPQMDSTIIKDMSLQLSKKKEARYVKVIATNFGKLPVWHQGYGDEAFIFVDEIGIK